MNENQFNGDKLFQFTGQQVQTVSFIIQTRDRVEKLRLQNATLFRIISANGRKLE